MQGVTPLTPNSPTNARIAKSDQVELGGAGFPGFPLTGNINIQTSVAGVGNAADTTDDVLMVYTLPAGAFDQAGRQLTILAIGQLANNAHSKRAKIFLNPTTAVVGQAISGGTLLADTLANTAAAVGWALEAQITKEGVFGANTQIGYSEPIVGTTHGGMTLPAQLALPENAPIVIAVTGSSASSAAGDVLANLLDISWAN